MPAEIRGGPSRTHRLPNQAEAEAAEQALLAKVPPPSRRPLAPPPPLPPELQDAPPTPYTQAMQRAATGTLQTGSPVGQALYGQPAEPAEPPGEDVPPPFAAQYAVRYEGDEVHVTLWTEDGRRAFTGAGLSLTEALSVAAGKLEEGLQQPVCPHCGQLMPQE